MQKIKEFIKNNHDRIILTVGAILIAGTSFAIGRLSINKQTIPIVINENTKQEAKTEQPLQNINTLDTETQKQDNDSNTKDTNAQEQNTQKNDTKQQKQVPKKTQAPKATQTSKNDCAFVASSRGHKYYNADSSSAKSLSEQNKICFPDAKSAEKAGYEPSASIK
ncbi:MAG: hypothetical protein WC663_03240 [Patescibacteria group bacterium]|jgi:hypothetical protein